MLFRIFVSILFVCLGVGCGEKSECMTDADCADGGTCVVSQDHKGDDHDHGGSCEAMEAADDTAEE